jgi:hypothetical protein
VLGLIDPESAEHRERAGVESDEVSTLGLRDVLDDDLVIERRDVPRDHGRACVEVDVIPSQAQALTPPASGGGEKDPRRQ